MSSPPRRAAVLVRTPLAMKVALEVVAELNADRARRDRLRAHARACDVDREARRHAEEARPEPSRASSHAPKPND